MRRRAKPEIIESMKVDVPKNGMDVLDFLGTINDDGAAIINFLDGVITIPTPRGDVIIRDGDLVAKTIFRGQYTNHERH